MTDELRLLDLPNGRVASGRHLSGRVDGTTVSLDVGHHYLGRLTMRNSYAVRFTGELRAHRGGTILSGSAHYRLDFAVGGFRLVRFCAGLFAILALIIGLEGLATGMADYAAGGLIVIPTLLLFFGPTRLDAFVARSARDDATWLIRFLEATLSDEPGRSPEPDRPTR